ncbi:MAG: hypothetical protein M1823_005999 [Watsoniomyces obsoletus]|nr:MAG: hypothetical protein M1823_005999 [Watsoniomyces obsoletus]
MHLWSLAVLAIWTGVTMAAPGGAPPGPLPNGDIEALRQMTQRGAFPPVERSTLPFEALKENLEPTVKRRKVCGQCMAILLLLHLQARLPEDTRAYQQRARFSISYARHWGFNKETAKAWKESPDYVRWTKAQEHGGWQWTWFMDNQEGLVTHSEKLAQYCSRLMSRPELGRVECHYFDFDTALAPIYDPTGDILHVINEFEDAEEGRPSEFRREKFPSPSLNIQSMVLGHAGHAVGAADLALRGMKDIALHGVPPSFGGAMARSLRPLASGFRLPKGRFVP